MIDQYWIDAKDDFDIFRIYASFIFGDWNILNQFVSES